MPIGDRDYIRGSHPPSCTCKECTDRRLGIWRGSARPPKTPHQKKSSGAPSGCWVSLLLVFGLLLLGFAGWSLWGDQSTSSQPPVTTPFPQSSPAEVDRPAPTLLPVEPTPTPEPEQVKPPTTPTVLSEPVKPPEYQYEELVAYALDLINNDRVVNGLAQVNIGSNSAAQKHAEERLANGYMSHWGMDGLKPYMRYTLAGGVNNEGENGFVTETIWFGGRDLSYIRDPMEMLKESQEDLMSSPGHRRNILDKWHKKVNLGIAYDAASLHLVQQFEGDYIDFNKLPSIAGNILSMAGKVTLGSIENIALYYDPSPQPLSPEQLESPPYDYAYGLGEDVGTILSPPPYGSFYIDLLPTDVIATKWTVKADGSFAIEADVSTILSKGKGIYTVVVWVETDNDFVAISNYSIFIP